MIVLRQIIILAAWQLAFEKGLFGSNNKWLLRHFYLCIFYIKIVLKHVNL